MFSSINAIATGEICEYDYDNQKFYSAYKKNKYHQSINVNHNGLENDKQADKIFHGGLDKAIHFGSSTHLIKYQKQYNKSLDKLSIGCNILLNNLTENDICIGDIYTIGNVTIEVSEPRQPCVKIVKLFGKEINQYFRKNNAYGWYARVLKEGIIYKNDSIQLQKRVSSFTIQKLSHFLQKPPDSLVIQEKILNLPALSKSYKEDLYNVIKNLHKLSQNTY